MASILLTKQLLEDAIYTGDTRSEYQYGLITNGSSSNITTTYSGISHSRPFYKGTSTIYYSLPAKFLAGGGAGVTKLFIYSGDRPDISSIVDMTAYDSQKLISFNVAAYSTSRGATGLYVETGSGTDYQGFKAICGICPTLTTAIASGSATWFFFGSALTNTEANAIKSGSSGNYTNVTVSPFITGSVGTLGSGSDLEIADRNIIAGQQYKSFGFNFYIPAINTVV